MAFPMACPEHTMPQPRITIITPNINQAQFIERTICSVLDQAYGNLEYIIVDRGSTDDSSRIIQLYEDEVAWATILAGSRGDAINHAMTRATGQIMAIVNGDEMLLPGALDEVARRMADDESIEWLVGGCQYVDEFDQSCGSVSPRAPRSLTSFLMHDSGVLPAPSSFFRRRCIERHGSFDTKLKFACDYEYYCRLLTGGVMPTIHGLELSTLRDDPEAHDAACTLQRGLELVDAALRYAHRLPRGQRHELWANCDQRRRIHTLAQAELAGTNAKRFVINELIRRPWWMADDAIRHTLVHGVAHPSPLRLTRPAA